MKLKFAIFITLLLVIIISIMFLFTTNLFAFPSIKSFNGHYYELVSAHADWTDAKNIARSKTYNSLQGHLVTITSEAESDFIRSNYNLEDTAWLGAYQKNSAATVDTGWCWVTGEKWEYINWGDFEPNDDGWDYLEDGEENYLQLLADCKWNDRREGFELQFIVEYEKRTEVKVDASAVEEIWLRNHEITCWQVWVNEDNMFQFSFIYPYADNNWVRIYDMSGNMVYEIDMPLDNPNIIVDLPGGTYTVKTFHDQIAPIQEFVIGKP